MRYLFAAAAMVIGSAAYAAPGDTETTTGFTVHNTPDESVRPRYEFAVTNFGFVPNLTKVMAGSPALLNSYVELQNNLRDQGMLSQAEINIVQMSIAVENGCSYCTAGHTMAGRVFFKTPEEHMRSVALQQQLSDPKLRELQAFAVALYDGRGHVTDDQMSRFLGAGYTRDQALDVVACVAAKVMSNYTNALADTELDEPLKPIAESLGAARR